MSYFGQDCMDMLYLVGDVGGDDRKAVVNLRYRSAVHLDNQMLLLFVLFVREFAKKISSFFSSPSTKALIFFKSFKKKFFFLVARPFPTPPPPLYSPHP